MRENEQFKDVFGMTTKGVYFAFVSGLQLAFTSLTVAQCLG